jgi:predicted RNA-binding Zn-ribbon protein involved in translation (DUF1610 family)
MTRRSKLTPEQIRSTLFTPCTQCGYKIQPSELLRVDGRLCRCPHCGVDFEPVKKAGATTQTKLLGRFDKMAVSIRDQRCNTLIRVRIAPSRASLIIYSEPSGFLD